MYHMILPLVTIIIGGIAGLIRYNRFSMIKILAQDFITAARARGISEKRLLFKHALKNALLPIITILISILIWTMDHQRKIIIVKI